LDALHRLASGPLPGAIEFTSEELRDAASMTSLEIDVLSAQGSPSQIRQVRSRESWSFDTALLNGHVRARGAFEPNHVVVLAVMRGGDAAICGVPLSDGVLLTVPNGEEITANIRPGVAYSAAVLPVEMWNDIVQVETGQHDLTAPHAIRASRQSSEYSERIRTDLAATLRSFDALSSQGLAGEMPAPFLDYLGSVAAAMADPENHDRHIDRSLRNRLRQAWLAEEFIRAHLKEPLSILQICRKVGVSRRQLEYAFNTTFGVGPTEYIRLARLNQIRRRLQSARASDRTVTEIAFDVGVTHLGRFAQSYRLLFGETPYRTLQRK
jgi:AraC family transcriptional regulator, ethanolamine operon transcriptional activator